MENNQRNSRKRLNSLILLVAFTAVMLIVSTYAWFSTQKNVTLGGLAGTVKVAEGLQISLDASNWVNSIDLSAAGIEAYFAATNAAGGTSYNLTTPYATRTNIIPSEFKPVSTTARAETGSGSGDADGIGLNDINMYMGNVQTASHATKSGYSLTEIKKADALPASGYYAIDFFLANTSGSRTQPDPLRLETNSLIKLATQSKESSGFQNTVRVGFALFTNTDESKVNAVDGESQADILEGTNGTISDVAIWEPNASGDAIDSTHYPAHVPEIVQALGTNKLTHPAAAKLVFDKDDEVDTYALTKASAAATEITGATGGGSIDDIYKWGTTPSTGLTKQNTLKTTTSGVQNPTQLVSVTNGTSPFQIAANQYHKLRMYVWIEGQDVDCLNKASYGGDVTIDVGLSKQGSDAS